MNSKTILGLDLGTNSVGWTLIEEMDGTPKGIRDGGVRIFIKSVEEKTPTPKNQARRKARLARRLVQRRARRKRRIRNFLMAKDLLPKELANNPAPENLLNRLGNPYALRRKALDEALSAHELGRVILHMAARRGFQSNRKTLWGNLIDDPDFLEIKAEAALGSEDKEEQDPMLSEEQAKEEKGMKADIAELWREIDNSGARTLGEYLAGLSLQERKRSRRTERRMYQRELELIWQKQSAYHAVVRDERFKKEIARLLFKQRPLKLAADRLGRCSLERQRPRARKAWPAVQRFRYWQDLNNLTYVNRKTGEYHELRLEDKHALAETLERQKTLSWAAIRKKLGLDRSVRFNLQESKKHLTGNLTACSLRKVIGERWDAMSAAKQNCLAEDLITIGDKCGLKNRLMNHWRFDAEQAIALATTDLDQGIANYSTKAIKKLLPYLQQGRELSKARVAAGYGYEQEETQETSRLGMPPHIPNPVISRALHEARKVINAIIHHYGKPDAIRIEMAREMKMSKKQKDAYQKQLNRNEKANARACEHYQSIGKNNPHLGLSQYPAKTDLIKYRLWEEAEEICVYSGRCIALTQLFSAEIEIDHILPFSRTLDDSFTNKVVCFASENRAKGDRTPYEAWHGTERYENIKQAIRVFRSSRKREAFYLTELKNDEFLTSQLGDTRYISREILHYVKQLYDTKTAHQAVSVSRGVFTAWLRHEWGLNTIISATDTKERSDHRHHLIDALVVALVSRGLYQKISARAKYKGDASSIDLNLDMPWESFRADVQGLLDDVLISHAPRRRIADALHEQTAYGVQQHPDSDGQRVVYRKPLNGDFTAKQIAKVVDPALKQKLDEHLEKHEGKPKLAFSAEQPFYFLPNQGRVRHVRIIAAENFNPASFLSINDVDGEPYKYYPFGNNHHVEILKSTAPDKKGKYQYKSEFVTAWAAVRRLRQGNKSYVKTDHGPDWQLSMVLCINDMVSVETEGVSQVYRVQKLEASANRLKLRKHNAATLGKKDEELLKAVSVLITTYKLKKLHISILGKMTHDQTDH